MLDSVFLWLNNIPLEGPIRAVVIIGIMLGFSAILFGIWEGLFNVIGRFRGTTK
jgi:hypothetical protein